MKTINILNYGAGNILSIRRAFEKFNTDVKFIDNYKDCKNLNNLIIPGVGSFSNAIKLLKEKKFYNEILDLNNKNIPIMGICLGMQLLFDYSEEFGHHDGLGLIKGRVIKIPEFSNNVQRKIPNIGWKNLNVTNDNSNFQNNSYVYFVHSFMCVPDNKKHIIAYTKYDSEYICAVVEKNNIFGTQFHPEKSSDSGLEYIKYFINKSYE